MLEDTLPKRIHLISIHFDTAKTQQFDCPSKDMNVELKNAVLVAESVHRRSW